VRDARRFRAVKVAHRTHRGSREGKTLLVDAAVRAGCHGTFDESVGAVGEDLDS
jgi:hypothetical protein